jgi:hypothetical protein
MNSLRLQPRIIRNRLIFMDEMLRLYLEQKPISLWRIMADRMAKIA